MIGLTLEAIEALRSERILAIIAKGAKEEIRISLRETEGRPFAAVRIWQKVGGDMVPTKAGFNLSPDALHDLVLGLETVECALREYQKAARDLMADMPEEAARARNSAKRG